MNIGQSFASFEVCGRCYQLRGPFDYAWKGQHYTFVQECRCERDARPGDGRPDKWMSLDFNTAAELCKGCGAEVLRSGSRWSVWFCGECKARVVECNRQAGLAVVPIGRHSMMHGVGLSGSSTRSEAEIDAFGALRADTCGTRFSRDRARAASARWRRTHAARARAGSRVMQLREESLGGQWTTRE